MNELIKKLQKYEVFLFDLDGTLISLDFEKFTNEYYRLLTLKVRSRIPERVFLSAMNAGLKSLFSNKGDKTNKEVFFEAFEQVAGQIDDELIKLFDHFYEVDFNNLSHLASPVPMARECLFHLKKNGKKVVLATNPVFPEKAVRKRISWADLDDFPFDLITTFETMHFCKPSDKYFCEVLEMISANPYETTMIGDDYELDISASKLAIDVWLINEKEQQYELNGHYVWKGNFQDFAKLVFEAYPVRKDRYL